MHADLGFETTRVVSFRVDPGAGGHDDERGKAFAKLLRERVEARRVVTGPPSPLIRSLGRRLNNRIDYDRRAYNPETRVSPTTASAPALHDLASACRRARLDERDNECLQQKAHRCCLVSPSERTFAHDTRRPISIVRRIGFGRDPERRRPPPPPRNRRLVADPRIWRHRQRPAALFSVPRGRSVDCDDVPGRREPPR